MEKKEKQEVDKNVKKEEKKVKWIFLLNLLSKFFNEMEFSSWFHQQNLK